MAPGYQSLSLLCPSTNDTASCFTVLALLGLMESLGTVPIDQAGEVFVIIESPEHRYRTQQRYRSNHPKPDSYADQIPESLRGWRILTADFADCCCDDLGKIEVSKEKAGQIRRQPSWLWQGITAGPMHFWREGIWGEFDRQSPMGFEDLGSERAETTRFLALRLMTPAEKYACRRLGQALLLTPASIQRVGGEKARLI